MTNTLDLSQLQQITGIQFRDEHILEHSLTHPSYRNEHPGLKLQDNERLEFLGDAVLDFISGEWLYERYPDGSEGYLTRLRSALVRTETLAGFSIHFSLDQALLLGRGEEEHGGRQRANNLCAVFEAFVGAIYLDQGIQVVRDLVFPFFEEALETILQHDLHKDPKSLLQEWSQANIGLTPSYQTIDTQGPDHAKLFTVAVYLGDKRYGEGRGTNKQSAAQAAAQQALEILKSSPES
ncbi:MAG: ribonuclease III [Anaerolineae bacterium]|nr:ribonuclease III [Anaerolineae bacterium]